MLVFEDYKGVVADGRLRVGQSDAVMESRFRGRKGRARSLRFLEPRGADSPGPRACRRAGRIAGGALEFKHRSKRDSNGGGGVNDAAVIQRVNASDRKSVV